MRMTARVMAVTMLCAVLSLVAAPARAQNNAQNLQHCAGVVHQPAPNGEGFSHVRVFAALKLPGRTPIQGGFSGEGLSEQQQMRLGNDRLVFFFWPIVQFGNYSYSVQGGGLSVQGNIQVTSGEIPCTEEQIRQMGREAGIFDVATTPSPRPTPSASDTVPTETPATPVIGDVVEEEVGDGWWVVWTVVAIAGVGIFVVGYFVYTSVTEIDPYGHPGYYDSGHPYDHYSGHPVHDYPGHPYDDAGHPGHDYAGHPFRPYDPIVDLVDVGEADEVAPILPEPDPVGPEDKNTTQTEDTRPDDERVYPPDPEVPPVTPDEETEEETEDDDCAELRARCEQLRAAAGDASERSRAARSRAETARAECQDARAARARAEAELKAAEAPPDESSWGESEGKKITTYDLQLENKAAADAWGRYQRGEISAEQLQAQWGRLHGDPEMLEELRKRDREARAARAAEARAALEQARAREAQACGAADTAEKEAADAGVAAERATAEANAACAAADECEKRAAEAAVDAPAVPSTPSTPSTPPVATPPASPPTPVTPPPSDPPLVPPSVPGDIAGPKGGQPILPLLIDGRTENDKRPCNCGPEITEAYLRSLNEIIRRLRDTVVALHTYLPGFGMAFLGLNGMKMDFKVEKSVGKCANCPRCVNTVTLLDKCVVDHAVNDLIFGICAGYWGTPETIQEIGGHVAEWASYGIGSWDSPVSQAIYTVGNKIGRKAYADPNYRVTESDLEALVSVSQKRIDCAPCKEKSTKPWTDFADADWTWPGGDK